MTNTPENESRAADEAHIAALMAERQDKEDERDAATLNGMRYKALTVEIDAATKEIARCRAALDAQT